MAIKTGYVCAMPGWSADKQVKALNDAGVMKIYIEGRGAETLEAAAKSLRGTDEVFCAAGLRILGSSRQEIVRQLGIVKKRGAVIVDIRTNKRSGPGQGAEMLDDALSDIHREKTMPRDGFAEEIGTKGAAGRWGAIWKRRKKPKLAKAIWQDKSIRSDAEAVRRCGEGWSVATLRREFGNSGRAKGRRPGKRK